MGEEGTEKNQHEEDLLSLSSTRVFWKSRRRRAPASKSSVEKAAKVADELTLETPEKLEELIPNDIEEPNESTPASAVLSERRKALFEPLEPTENLSRKRQSAESLLPPPDFDTSTYPKGWLVGKKRKLVNVDVVESMRRIAVQELNRKDREIDGLNEQLDEDARCLEHLQIQLLEEKRKKAEVERENALLQDQINMLMNMLQENDNMQEEDDDGAEEQKPF